MLVLSREVGTSILVNTASEMAIVTILTLHPDRRSISIRIGRATPGNLGGLVPESVEVGADVPVDIGNDVQLSLVELRDNKARVGITAASSALVYRWEAYEAFLRENQAVRSCGPEEDGLAGAPVPRPSKPNPRRLTFVW